MRVRDEGEGGRDERGKVNNEEGEVKDQRRRMRY